MSRNYASDSRMEKLRADMELQRLSIEAEKDKVMMDRSLTECNAIATMRSWRYERVQKRIKNVTQSRNYKCRLR